MIVAALRWCAAFESTLKQPRSRLRFSQTSTRPILLACLSSFASTLPFHSRLVRGIGAAGASVSYEPFTQGHFCMVFETLGPSLYDYVKANEYRPVPLYALQAFADQLITSVAFLHAMQLVHTDLKVRGWVHIDLEVRQYRWRAWGAQCLLLLLLLEHAPRFLQLENILLCCREPYVKTSKPTSTRAATTALAPRQTDIKRACTLFSRKRGLPGDARTVYSSQSSTLAGRRTTTSTSRPSFARGSTGPQR